MNNNQGWHHLEMCTAAFCLDYHDTTGLTITELPNNIIISPNNGYKIVPHSTYVFTPASTL